MTRDAPNPWEVEIMITNLELTLDKMKKQAEREGEKRGRMEVAKAALRKNLTVDVVAEITGLTQGNSTEP